MKLGTIGWILVAVAAYLILFKRPPAAGAEETTGSTPPPPPAPTLTPIERAQASLPPGTPVDFTGSKFEPTISA